MQLELLPIVKAALSKALHGQSVDHYPLLAKLKDDLGLDSMTSLTFLMALEDMIEGFIVDPETLEVNDLESIETITSYVERQLARVH